MEFEVIYRHGNFTFNIHGKSASGYTCRVTKINYNPSLKSIILKGEHIEGKNNEDVVGVAIKGIHLKTIPLGLYRLFPRLLYMEMSKCGLKTLTKKDLIGLENLRGLWLPDNDISSLDDNVFENTPGIRILCFKNNLLKYIGADVLKPLKNLTDANFLNNTRINKEYKNGNKEQLNALIQDIIVKCQESVEISEQNEKKLEDIAMQKEIKQLKDHISVLEERIKILEKKNESNLTFRLNQLEEIISGVQLRLSTVEDTHY